MRAKGAAVMQQEQKATGKMFDITHHQNGQNLLVNT